MFKKPVLRLILETELHKLVLLTARIREAEVRSIQEAQRLNQEQFVPAAEELERLRLVYVGGPDAIWKN